MGWLLGFEGSISQDHDISPKGLLHRDSGHFAAVTCEPRIRLVVFWDIV